MSKVLFRVKDGYTYQGCEPRLEVFLCGGCGIMMGVPEDWLDRRRKDGQGWYCPNGCSRVFRETEEDRLRKMLERSREYGNRVASERDQIERSRRAVKGTLTKTRKRIAAGVCPCCNRTFQDLARHMKGQHPDYTERVNHD